MGDSHSLLFHFEGPTKHWTSPKLAEAFDVRWLGSITLWRVCRDKDECVNFDHGVNHHPIGSAVSTKAELGQNILLVFGEIDVRCHIYKQGGENYKQTIDSMLQGYESFLNSHKDKYKLHVCAIVPPMVASRCTSPNSDLPFLGSDEYRAEVAEYLNRSLGALAAKIGIGFCDIYPLYLGENGMINYEKSDTVVHGIKTKELEEYLEKYFEL